MPKLTAVMMLAALVLGIGACSSVAPAEEEITTRATVRFVNVEGGCWRLDAVDGRRYDPIGLPAAFRTDGRRVVVRLGFTGTLGSFCMVGELARVVDIRDE